MAEMLEFVSPKNGMPLIRRGSTYSTSDGESYPIVDGIPRFVTSDNYAAGFGLEWKAHAKTQLDSYSGSRISQSRLERCLGMSLDMLKGKKVLEAGCGAGRFTELLVKAGALVHAVDLSLAVEANAENIGNLPNYRIAQANLLEFPFPSAFFDVVVCIGVIQHTPNPEQSIKSLYKMVIPGGLLVIDHYTWSISLVTKLAPLYRLYIRTLPPERAKKITDMLTDLFFPLHWKVRKFRFGQMLLSRISPCLVYFDAFPSLSKHQHYEWCKLDTFDHTADHYKHLRTSGQIKKTLQALNATDIFVWKGGNGIEARCMRPLI